jgi:protein O-GlcNAc transferase
MTPSPVAPSPPPVAQTLQQAIALHQAGRLQEAERLYRAILQTHPQHAEAQHNLGVLAVQSGRPFVALDHFDAALTGQPQQLQYWLNYLDALVKTGAPAADPQQLLAIARLFAQGQIALAALLASENLFAADARAHLLLGNTLIGLGLPEAAAECFRRALGINPDYAEALNNLAYALRELGRFEQAEPLCRRSLQQKPDCAEAHNNLGVIQKQLWRAREAAASFRLALQIRPDYPDALVNLGSALRETGAASEAVECFQRLLQINPDHADARWQMMVSQIPPVAETEDEVLAGRAAFLRELTDLDTWFDAGKTPGGYKAVGPHPFYLAYQEENNRDLLMRYGALCARLMQGKASVRGKGATDGKLRVGVVSAHICIQSVWDAIVKGWYQHLERDRIELHTFYLGTRQDSETEWAKSRSASFDQGKTQVGQWLSAIAEKQLDVLIYPEIGMDAMTIKLASQRLAPVQIAAWGHPETSGLPTLDYYLSAELLEPECAQDNYSEQLVALPNLGCHYHPAEITPLAPDFAAWGIDPDAPILLCPGAPFKYAPEHDTVLVEIARCLPRCQLVFFTHYNRELTEKLLARLTRAFASEGLDFGDYLRVAPWLSKPAFYGLMERASVFLDTIGFSGFNTAMQALECGLPVVTREGQFMRGRLASGILKRMGMTELITDTQAQYIALAVRLAEDAAYRQDVKNRIATARAVLFDDVEPVRALQTFLFEAAKRDVC